MDDCERAPPVGGEVLGQHHRLLVERADLVVEHELAASVRAAGVVDRGHLGVVGQVAYHEPVVADRRPDHGEGAGVDQLEETELDLARGAERQPAREVREQLDGAVDAARRRDVVDAEPHRVFERRAAVGLREVVEEADDDG